MGFPGGTVVVENPPIQNKMQETQVRSLGQKDPLEQEMATHSSMLGWKIPWTEESGGQQSMGLQSWTRLSTHTHTHTHTKNKYILYVNFIHLVI